MGEVLLQEISNVCTLIEQQPVHLWNTIDKSDEEVVPSWEIKIDWLVWVNSNHVATVLPQEYWPGCLFTPQVDCSWFISVNWHT